MSSLICENILHLNKADRHERLCLSMLIALFSTHYESEDNDDRTKRVCALYRVSTAGQVEKDDIPMQKQECREFANNMGWKIVKEYFEKGVSGYKVSAKNRDAIQSIQQDALRGTFDILLVFMFDRLGRRDDETPFVVEWFVKNGIEVWSTREGQQRFDTHVDKLMNYIRYWQASGESLKTSIRTKTRLEQLTAQGHYTGGSVPFGYRIEKQGRVNKRNHEVCELVVDEQEAEIVRLIFHKYVTRAMAHRDSATGWTTRASGAEAAGTSPTPASTV